LDPEPFEPKFTPIASLHVGVAISKAQISNFKYLQSSKTQLIGQGVPLVVASVDPAGNQLVQVLVLIQEVVACKLNIDVRDVRATLVLMEIVQYL